MENKFIEIVDLGENNTMNYYKVNYAFLVPKKNEEYKKDARKLLDKLSKDFNPMGLDALMGQILYELLQEEYYGSENPSRNKSKV